MRNANRFFICSASAALLAAPTSALAAPYTLSLRGEVPVICHATVRDAAPVSDGGETRAMLEEFCNSSAGYRVYATVSDPSVQVSLDGQPVSANADGRYLLSDMRGPTMASRTLALSGAQGAAISITVVVS